LRVRKCGGHFVQTVKSENSASAGLMRGEWEDAVASAKPEPLAPESGRFLEPEIAERLVPLFRTEVARRTIDLRPTPGTHIEAAIDRGRICAVSNDASQQNSEPISEVELELKDGSATALYDVAIDLLAVAPVRLERRSKAERGYRLSEADPVPPAAVHAVAVDLDPTMSGNEALRRIGLACLDQLLRNEPAVMAGMAEGIHQMRVAVRRLRAILSAFSKLLPKEERSRASSELRWLADALGAVRNLDVFEAALLAPARPVVIETDGLAALTAMAANRRRASWVKATKAVRSPRYTAMLLRLLRWFESCGWRGDAASADLDQPIAGFATRLLDQRRKVAQGRSRGFAKQSPPQRHRLRIALKKLRYTTELLAGLYDPAKVNRFTRRLKRLQDDLGDANDLRVARDIVVQLTAPKGRNGGIAAAAEAVLKWHSRRLARREPQLREHLESLLDAEPFWTA
jgi:inorganic triphosphatase YgiF